MDTNQLVQQSTAVVKPPASTPAPPVSPSPIPPASHSRKPLIFAGLGILILIAVIVGGLVLLSAQKNQNQTPSAPPTATPIPTPFEPVYIELALEKGKKAPIPDSNVTITYVGADISNPNCADCSTTTDITLEENGISKKLQYLCGGIAGECTDSLNAYGYEVEIVTVTESTATVMIRKL